MPNTLLGNDIHFSGIRYGIKGDNPHQIIKNLSWLIARDIVLPPSATQDQMEYLLKKSIAGVGDGVAVFDWVSEKIEEPYLMCATLESPIMFPAVDDRAVDITLILVSPSKNGPLHLQHLARVTRMFREPKLLEKLRNVSCVDGLRSVLSPENRKLLAA